MTDPRPWVDHHKVATLGAQWATDSHPTMWGNPFGLPAPREDMREFRDYSKARYARLVHALSGKCTLCHGPNANHYYAPDKVLCVNCKRNETRAYKRRGQVAPKPLLSIPVSSLQP